jgi:hypothetical protein
MLLSLYFKYAPSKKAPPYLSLGRTNMSTVHRPGDDPRKECEECGNARGSNVRYYPT